MSEQEESNTRCFSKIIDEHEAATLGVGVYSSELGVNVRMRQGSVLSRFLFAFVVNVVIELPTDGALSEFLYPDDLFMMTETIKGFWNKFGKLCEPLNDVLRVSLVNKPRCCSVAVLQRMVCLTMMFVSFALKY